MISMALCSSRTRSRSPCFANITIVCASVFALGSSWPGVYLRKSHLIHSNHNGNLVRSESRIFEVASSLRTMGRNRNSNGLSAPVSFLTGNADELWHYSPPRDGQTQPLKQKLRPGCALA